MQIKITRYIEIPVEITATVIKGQKGNNYDVETIPDELADIEYNLPANAILNSFNNLKNNSLEETYTELWEEVELQKQKHFEV